MVKYGIEIYAKIKPAKGKIGVSLVSFKSDFWYYFVLFVQSLEPCSFVVFVYSFLLYLSGQAKIIAKEVC